MSTRYRVSLTGGMVLSVGNLQSAALAVATRQHPCYFVAATIDPANKARISFDGRTPVISWLPVVGDGSEPPWLADLSRILSHS
jgi:hypothetical protein